MRLRPVAIAVAASALACGGPDSGTPVATTSVDIPRPSFTLTSTDGQPFEFRSKTAGKLTFLEFGYTNCPDICPVHMANLGTVLRKLAPSDRMKTMVVFVSVDPDRDSLHVLRKWLDAFDVDFVGLTGSRAALDSAQLSVGFGAAIVRSAAPGSGQTTLVDHASPVVVFTADDTAHALYPFGTRQADWDRDLPRLLAVAPAVRAATPDAARIEVNRAYVVTPIGNAPAAGYVEIRNTGARSDTLLGISAAGLGAASIHQSVIDGQRARMDAVQRLIIRAGETVQFAPGSYHAMIDPAGKPLLRGETVKLSLRFAKSGSVGADAMVIGPGDVDMATARRP